MPSMTSPITRKNTKDAGTSIAARKAGLSSTLSPRALMTSEKPRGSFTQPEISPQRTSAKWRAPSHNRTTGDRLRRRHVVAWRKVGLLQIAKKRPHRFRSGYDQIASAHGGRPGPFSPGAGNEHVTR